MYSYDWDSSTGGYILNSTPLKFSKEPRPVYYKELDNDCKLYRRSAGGNLFYLRRHRER